MGPDETCFTKNTENHVKTIEQNLEHYIGNSIYLSKREKEKLKEDIKKIYKD